MQEKNVCFIAKREIGRAQVLIVIWGIWVKGIWEFFYFPLFLNYVQVKSQEEKLLTYFMECNQKKSSIIPQRLHQTFSQGLVLFLPLEKHVFNEEETAPSISGSGKTGQSHVKE